MEDRTATATNTGATRTKVTPAERRILWEDQAAKGFASHATKLGLNGDFIGKKFMVDGIEYEVRGINKRIRKLPVIAKTAEGVYRTFPFETVKSGS